MTTEPLRNVKDHFSDFVERVRRDHERVVVTKNGRPAAVLISVEDLESMEDTLDILSEPGALERIQASRAAGAAGDYIEGVDAVRALLPRHA